jgi:hypothetical protein
MIRDSQMEICISLNTKWRHKVKMLMLHNLFSKRLIEEAHCYFKHTQRSHHLEPCNGRNDTLRSLYNLSSIIHLFLALSLLAQKKLPKDVDWLNAMHES